MIIFDPTLKAKFDTVSDEQISKRLLPAQKIFVHEYISVMKNIACALDILQGESSMGLGYLLPTLFVLNSKLQKLLVICQPLV